MITTNIYILILANAIIVFAIEKIMNIFFEKKKTSLPVTVLSYLFLLVTILLPLWMENLTLHIIMYFLALFIITLNYESMMTKRLSAVIGGHFAIHSATGLSQTIFIIFSHDLFNYFLEFMVILTSLLIYLMSFLMFRYFKNIKKITVSLNKLLLPVLYILALHALSTILFTINITAASLIQFLGNHFGIIFIFFYLYNNISKTFEDNIKSALFSQEKEYYFTQYQLMSESMDKVKSIRHDMKLHLAALKDYITDNKAASDYLNSLLEDISESEIYSNTGNIAFDSIINFKFKNAIEDNIKLDLRIAIPPDINMEVSDIVTVLGNLLDNALEAVSKVNDKIIKLDIEFGKGGLFAKVENTFNGEIKYADESTGDEKQIISLKSSNDHGYGLKNIKRIIEKYNGYMKISHTDNIFSAGVFMYVDG